MQHDSRCSQGANWVIKHFKGRSADFRSSDFSRANHAKKLSTFRTTFQWSTISNPKKSEIWSFWNIRSSISFFQLLNNATAFFFSCRFYDWMARSTSVPAAISLSTQLCRSSRNNFVEPATLRIMERWLRTALVTASSATY